MRRLLTAREIAIWVGCFLSISVVLVVIGFTSDDPDSALYAALDLRRITAAEVTWEGRDQGPLAPVSPPVRFGFSSTPKAPSIVRVTTTVVPDPTR